MRTSPTSTLPPPPSSSAATAAVLSVANQLIHLAPPLSTATSSAATNCSGAHGGGDCLWRHYSGGGRDFEANAALVLIILLCALICALALNASIRCFLRGGGGGGSGGHHRGPIDGDLPRSETELAQLQQKAVNGGAPLESMPTLVYSSAMRTKLAGVEAECVICLSEFVEGEEIRVLGWCKHGFHSQCIQEWFATHSSCPTCRQSFRPPSPSSVASESDRAVQSSSLTTTV